MSEGGSIVALRYVQKKSGRERISGSLDRGEGGVTQRLQPSCHGRLSPLSRSKYEKVLLETEMQVSFVLVDGI